MTGPRVDPFADLAGLANRIAQSLKANPKDAQARADLKYLRSLMPATARDVSATDNPPEPPAGQQVRAGLSAVPGDLIHGFLTSLLHPMNTLGQVSGVANREAWGAAKYDPTLSIPEKADAFVRATPLNAGYAPFRAFLESTGLKSDEAAPLGEQVRQGGDIAASLALSRVSPGKVGGAVLRAGMRALRIPRWINDVQPRVAKVLGKGADPQTVMSVAETAIRSRLDRQGFSPENIEQLVATWKRGGRLESKPPAPPAPPAPPTLRPGETVEPIAEKGLAVYGTRATPPPPANGSFWEQVNGSSIRDLGKGQTLPYYPRGGAVEQGVAPTPQSSTPNLAPNQNAAFADFLKGATPEDLASRVGTLRALGIPLPPNAETELLAYLQAGTPR